MNVIVKHIAGSISYGTNIEGSDTDIRGIYMAPNGDFLNPFKDASSELTIPEDEDSKLYELNFYLPKYCNGDPNMIESLWVDDKFIIESSESYDLLRKHRSDLLSKRLAYTFTGYAFQQLKGLKSRNKWVNRPEPKDAYSPIDFYKLVYNYTDDKLLSRDFNIRDYLEGYKAIKYSTNLFGLYKDDSCSLFNLDGSIRLDHGTDDKSKPVMIIKFLEEEYKAKKTNHKNYWDWVKSRNVKRSANEAKFGYCTKNAMHLVRLLRMGREIITTGEVNVFRKDAEELLSIRDGAWSYEDLISYASSLDSEIKNLKEFSSLPDKPDLKLASKLIKEIRGV